jgi:hypothetical protein
LLELRGYPFDGFRINYVNKKYAEISPEISVMKKAKGQLTLELDEMWSFVKNKRNKHNTVQLSLKPL